MRVALVTIFPEVVDLASFSILRIAREKGLLELVEIDPREFTHDLHRTVDDAPFGGGAGMVMKPGPLFRAIERAKEKVPGAPVYLLSPAGEPFTQQTAREWSKLPGFTLVCGRYEGIDARVEAMVDGLVSLGDFVLSGGELAAMAMVDAVCRLIPGVVGRAESVSEESFEGGLLEYPHYTRPAEFEGREVPEVLLSGDHSRIASWRRRESIRLTWERRPDLLLSAPLDPEDKRCLTELIGGEGESA